MAGGRTRKQDVAIVLALLVAVGWTYLGVTSSPWWLLLAAFWLIYGAIGLFRPQAMWGPPKK